MAISFRVSFCFCGIVLDGNDEDDEDKEDREVREGGLDSEVSEEEVRMENKLDVLLDLLVGCITGSGVR